MLRTAQLLLVAVLPSCLQAGAETGVEFFENKVRPILVARCYDCHSEQAGKRKGGLWLDRKAGWEFGGDSGPALFPKDIDRSLLLHSIDYRDEDLQMPPKARLPEAEIQTLRRWVAMGAPDPRDAALAGAVRKTEINYEEARKSWAYRPLQQQAPPVIRNDNWSRGSIDKFILADLHSQKLEPVADAAPNTLLRRVYYDVTGLPPTPDEIEAFQKAPSESAFVTVVDDLLSRQAFGEKWGRHWLDVARYSDSNGGDRNFTYYQAWRYRNYVIESFNSDRSYYDFVRHQIAGDLLPWESDRQRHDQLVGSTFLALGPKMLTERDKEKLRLDVADEQVDTVGRAFLGLTMGCARCHDHKFDPISQEDYYAMAGIFRSTQVVLGTRNGCVNVASWVEEALPVAEPKRSETAAKVKRLELAMRLTVERQFKKKAGGQAARDELPFAGVIYDEADAELRGKWRKSKLNPKRFGDGYIVHDADTGESSAVFRASLPENGLYEVRVAYSSDRRRANNIPITIEAWDKIRHVTLDQTRKPAIADLFQPIGRFKFEKGGRANLIIESKGTKDFLIVDAVQFVAVTDIKREARAIAEATKGRSDSLFTMTEKQLKSELSKLIKELKTADVAMVPRDATDAADIHLRVRGEVSRLGKKVRRNFPKVVHASGAPKIAEGQSGRLQLAEWMASRDNALLDRVIVNRIWHNLFGRGIVQSVDNFGRLGTPPTHPDLLDHLAADFRANKGSLKKLIRKIVLSRAYQQSAIASAAVEKADPENKYFSRRNRRRLTAEEIRDSVLFLSGRLASKPGTSTATKYGTDLDKPMSFSKETLRTVYLPIARNNLVAELELFDAANPDLVSGTRATTTVPTQALYLLNNEFFTEQADVIGREAAEQSAEIDQIKHLYNAILSRQPGYIEGQRANEFLFQIMNNSEMNRDEALGHLAHLLLVSTEFLFLDFIK